jgi:hypothetical protein
VTTPDRLLRVCLTGLILSLLLIGVVSATPLRHLVQAIPVIVALGLVWRGIGWSPYAALPLFLFWLLLISLIWLFIFGLANVITGTFSLPERILTVAIILSCVLGIGAALRASPVSGWKIRSLAFLAFALLAVAAMWASLHPLFARR